MILWHLRVSISLEGFWPTHLELIWVLVIHLDWGLVVNFEIKLKIFDLVFSAENLVDLKKILIFFLFGPEFIEILVLVLVRKNFRLLFVDVSNFQNIWVGLRQNILIR